MAEDIMAKDTMWQVGDKFSLWTNPTMKTIEVQIHSIPCEFTLSAVMVVDILSKGSLDLPDRAFLKLFDRRYSHGQRECLKRETWTPELDQELLEFSRSGEAQKLLFKHRRENDVKRYELDPVGQEVILWAEMQDQYHNELFCYKELKKHQGRLIPKFFTSVFYCYFKEGHNSKFGPTPGLFRASGILIEHIDGITLYDLPKHVEWQWTAVAKRAIQVTEEVLNGSRVMNEDVGPKNMMYVEEDAARDNAPGLLFPNLRRKEYRLVMVDFACGELQEHESDEEWAKMKEKCDEVSLMRSRLRTLCDFDEI